MTLQKSFSQKLLRWHKMNPRDMPWKKTRDAYKIWLSEVILQQTRVEQGIPYYKKLVKYFPTVAHLANAGEDEVMKAWEGLGYYTRARNLHAAAKQVKNDYAGKFPSSYEEILGLKGVGNYTAAAISSFAFDLPHAVVDGNVFRVLSRVFGVREPVDSGEGRKTFFALANDLLDKKNPAAYNQAIMNFGALVCLPVNPVCQECIFRKTCFAFTHQQVPEFPVKSKKNAVRTRWFNFLVLEDGGKVIIEKRNEKDIWKSLFQFPLVETETFARSDEVLKIFSREKKLTGRNLKVTGISPVIEHKLTHQIIKGQFVRVSTSLPKLKMPAGWQAIKKTEINKFGFPKLLVNYFEKLLH